MARMAAIVGLAILAAVGLLARPAGAVFHNAVIDQVVTSVGGDANQQFVEIRMLADFQNADFNTVLGAFDAAGNHLGDVLVVPANVPNGGAGVRWIMATDAFQTAQGFTADFSIPAGILPVNDGMICWGAPGIVPPAPGSWDHGVPTNYVDCVAYGAFTGANSPSGPPVPASPADHALARTATTMKDDADFACEPTLTPTNNAGTTKSIDGAPCSTATTTTTMPGTTVTTSTATTTVPTTTIHLATTTTLTHVSTTTTVTVPGGMACGGCAFGDPSCCHETASMEIHTARLNRGHPGPMGGFGIRATVAAPGFAGIDPLQDDVVLQLGSGAGELLCAVIPHGSWRTGRGKRFHFSDRRGVVADGVTKALLAVGRDGSVTLAIEGRGLDAARFTPALDVGVRVGDACSAGMVSLKAKQRTLRRP